MSDRKDIRLDDALGQLAAGVAPGEALMARVLADAAMVSAERRPAATAAARPTRAAAVTGATRGWFGRFFGDGLFGPAGAVTVMGLCLALGLGLGFNNDREVLEQTDMDEVLLAQISEFDAMRDEVIAAADEDLFGLDAPL